MKHMDPPDLDTMLAEHLLQAGVLVSHGQKDALLRHLHLVLETNKETNLTAIRNPEDALRLHTIDSIQALDSIPALTTALADIGSGQGYPAIPFGILRPKMKVTMIESNERKARFLQATVRSLGIGCRVEVLNCRAECVPPAILGTYDVVTARAVASLAALVELASPFLKQGGILVAMKGSPEAKELGAANNAAVHCGMSPGLHRSYILANGSEERTISIYRKVERPSITLPRRVGLAQKRPLK